MESQLQQSCHPKHPTNCIAMFLLTRSAGWKDTNYRRLLLPELSADASITNVVVWQQAFLMGCGLWRQGAMLGVKHWTKTHSDWSRECWNSLWTQLPWQYQCYSSLLSPVSPQVPLQWIESWQGWWQWGELHATGRWRFAQPGRSAGSQRTPERTHQLSSYLQHIKVNST